MNDVDDPHDDLTVRQLRALNYRVVVKPPKRPQGRPAILKGSKGSKRSKEDIDRLMHIWIAIAVIRAQTKSINAALDRLFTAKKSDNSVGKRWLAFIGDEDNYEVISKDIARRRYYEAQRLLKEDPELHSKWTHNLKLAKELGDDPLNYGIPPKQSDLIT